jgi:hypothetical protein
MTLLGGKRLRGDPTETRATYSGEKEATKSDEGEGDDRTGAHSVPVTWLPDVAPNLLKIRLKISGLSSGSRHRSVRTQTPQRRE